MESANSHRHQLQDQIVGSSSCSLATPSCYGVGTTSARAWTPSILNTTGFSTSHANETILNSREIRMQENTPLISSQYSSLAPELGFHWVNTAGNFTLTNQSTQDLQHSRIKEELSDQYYRRYNEILSSSSPSSNDELLSRSEQGNLQPDDLSTKLLLKSLSSGNLMDKIHLSPGDLYANNGGRVGVSQIFPSVNVPNLNQTGSTNPVSLDMNLEALDLLASSRFNGNFGHSSQNQIGPLRDDFANYGFGHMQQPHQIPLYSSSEASASSNGGAEAKRSSTKMEPKAPLHGAPKKSRLETRTSCPPFKVRKEKLGDRIAALQQLVAPFGKTDTASVLMEAIGYIKFLQNQIETLSVPYMKASRNKPTRAVKGGGRPAEIGNCEEDAAKRDLKSRGLCLVPLSCLSYIADGGGAVVWPPPHFGGATQLVTQRR